MAKDWNTDRPYPNDRELGLEPEPDKEEDSDDEDAIERFLDDEEPETDSWEEE